MVEWQEAAECANFGLEAYADALLLGCLEAVREPAILAGHSLGGTFAAVFASLHPERVRGLVLLETPAAFGNDAGSIAALVRATEIPGALAGEQIPGTVVGAFGVAASPASFFWSPWLDWVACMTDPVARRTHDLVLRWTLDEFPLSRKLVAEVVHGLYREDRFMTGTLPVAGRTAAAKNVAAPVFAVVDPQSDIVPPASVLPFVEAVPGRDKKVTQYEGDVGVGLRHVGVLIGRSAHHRLWPRILAWARRH